MKRRWPNRSLSNARRAIARSALRVAEISFSRNGWQRMAPWPNTIRLRVRMFAPSTVIATGSDMYADAMKFDGPMQMPLPPTMSIASLTTTRARSVRCSLAMPDSTAGFSPRSTACAVNVRVASIM